MSYFDWQKAWLVTFLVPSVAGETRLECCVHVMTDIIDDAQDVLARGVEISLEGAGSPKIWRER
jgi:hypothetical protein